MKGTSKTPPAGSPCRPPRSVAPAITRNDSLQTLVHQLGGTSWQTNSDWGNVIFTIDGKKAIIPNGEMEIVNRKQNRFTGNYSNYGQYQGPIQLEIVPNGQIFFWRDNVNESTLPEIWKKIE